MNISEDIKELFVLSLFESDEASALTNQAGRYIEELQAKIDRLTSRGIEDMKYQLDLQKKYLLESAAQINGLNYSLAMLASAATNNTGNEPSISVYHRALDEAHEVLAKTPAQSLHTIQSQAVTDLITECSYSTQVNGIATSIIDVDRAISYADRLGEG